MERRTFNTWNRTVLVAGLLVPLPLDAAGDSPLILKIRQQGERTGAPLEAELELEWTEKTILPGILKLDLISFC